jgi:hypothetical protein
MTMALRAPERVSGLIPVDNAPVNASLKSDFPKYVRGMQHVENEKVKKQSEANKILEAYEEVCQPYDQSVYALMTQALTALLFSLLEFVNSFSPT